MMDYDAILAATGDENGLQPTQGAQDVLRAVLEELDAVDERWVEYGCPEAADYAIAIRNRLGGWK